MTTFRVVFYSSATVYGVHVTAEYEYRAILAAARECVARGAFSSRSAAFRAHMGCFPVSGAKARVVSYGGVENPNYVPGAKCPAGEFC